MSLPLRTLVLGGAGNFGARIVRALAQDAQFEVIIASRHATSDRSAARTACLDIRATDFEARLRALAPDLVIHTAGPFQGQDYAVVRAALAAGAHYVDLADGREFVTRFCAANELHARAARRNAICGASTLPALSSAVVDELVRGLKRLESIEIVIAPGQRAARGRATVEAVFGYLGSPFQIWQKGAWRSRHGWMQLQRVRLSIGDRLGALCDVPDLDLFPARYAGVESVVFRAALEFRIQHWALYGLGCLKRVAPSLPVARFGAALNRVAPWFDRFAGEFGAMSVRVCGEDGSGRVRRTWQLTVAARDGPEIPCFAALLIARRLARGEALSDGAQVCMGFLALADFAELFALFGITTSMQEVRH